MKKKSKKNIKMVKKYTHTVNQQCPLCGKISFMRLQEQEYKQWEHYVCYRGLMFWYKAGKICLHDMKYMGLTALDCKLFGLLDQAGITALIKITDHMVPQGYI